MAKTAPWFQREDECEHAESGVCKVPTWNGVTGELMAGSTAVIEEPAAVENEEQPAKKWNCTLPASGMAIRYTGPAACNIGKLVIASDVAIGDIWSPLEMTTIDAGCLSTVTVEPGEWQDGHITGDELCIKEQRALLTRDLQFPYEWKTQLPLRW